MRTVVLVVAALIPTTMLSRDDVAVRLATRSKSIRGGRVLSGRSMCLLHWGALRGTAGYCDVG